MFVRKTAIDAVGAMDEAYFLHCEDLDWCMRFKLAGWKILFVPDVKVTHVQGSSSRKYSNSNSRRNNKHIDTRRE